MRFILLIFCFSVFTCSKSDELPNCSEGYPKVFNNQTILDNKIDVYHYDLGNLTFINSIPVPGGASSRTITLLNQTKLSDTSHPVDIDYELVDGVIKDFRNYIRITINENCDVITTNYLHIGVNGSWVNGIYECGKTDSLVIAEAIDYYATSQVFDTVQILRFNEELSLAN